MLLPRFAVRSSPAASRIVAALVVLLVEVDLALQVGLQLLLPVSARRRVLADGRVEGTAVARLKGLILQQKRRDKPSPETINLAQ